MDSRQCLLPQHTNIMNFNLFLWHGLVLHQMNFCISIRFHSIGSKLTFVLVCSLYIRTGNPSMENVWVCRGINHILIPWVIEGLGGVLILLDFIVVKRCRYYIFHFSRVHQIFFPVSCHHGETHWLLSHISGFHFKLCQEQFKRVHLYSYIVWNWPKLRQSNRPHAL